MRNLVALELLDVLVEGGARFLKQVDRPTTNNSDGGEECWEVADREEACEKLCRALRAQPPRSKNHRRPFPRDNNNSNSNNNQVSPRRTADSSRVSVPATTSNTNVASISPDTWRHSNTLLLFLQGGPTTTTEAYSSTVAAAASPETVDLALRLLVGTPSLSQQDSSFFISRLRDRNGPDASADIFGAAAAAAARGAIVESASLFESPLPRQTTAARALTRALQQLGYTSSLPMGAQQGTTDVPALLALLQGELSRGPTVRR
jgi:hypothetical protein